MQQQQLPAHLANSGPAANPQQQQQQQVATSQSNPAGRRIATLDGRVGRFERQSRGGFYYFTNDAGVEEYVRGKDNFRFLD